jgi:hypothetical protein
MPTRPSPAGDCQAGARARHERDTRTPPIALRIEGAQTNTEPCSHGASPRAPLLPFLSPSHRTVRYIGDPNATISRHVPLKLFGEAAPIFRLLPRRLIRKQSGKFRRNIHEVLTAVLGGRELQGHP